MLEVFKNDFAGICKEASFYPYRKKSFERFETLPFPESLKPFQGLQAAPKTEITPALDISPFVYPECQGSLLVFVNGAFAPELSDTSLLPASAILLPLTLAEKQYGTFFKQHFKEVINSEQNSLSLLNLALHKEGCFLYIPPKEILKKPIFCLHLLTEPRYAFPRIHLSLGAESHAKVILSTKILSREAPLSHMHLDLSLERNASCHITELLTGEYSGMLSQTFRARLKKDSTLTSVCVTKGAEQTAYQDYHVTLLEEGTSATLQGLSLLGKHKKADIRVLLEHLAPHTHSMQHFKGLLQSLSKSKFQGKIKVAKEAQKTESYQLNNHLILGPNAFASSDPTLEIFADDVKASHGATIAEIDPKQLLYLKTRGIDESLGKQLLIQGFCGEITTKIPHLFLVKDLLNDPFFHG